MLIINKKFVMMVRKLMVQRMMALNISFQSTTLFMRYSASDSRRGWWQLPFWIQLGGGALSDAASDIGLEQAYHYILYTGIGIGSGWPRWWPSLQLYSRSEHFTQTASSVTTKMYSLKCQGWNLFTLQSSCIVRVGIIVHSHTCLQENAGGDCMQHWWCSFR